MLTFSRFRKLSTSNISYLVNHTTKMRILYLSRCDLCEDGGVITKDEGKLKYAECLELNNNAYLNDESIINLVKGCHNLEYIDIENCPKLTDASLFSIAENCPNLNEIHLDFDNVNMTTLGLIELLKKCLKLSDIFSKVEKLPTVINVKLKKRKSK